MEADLGLTGGIAAVSGAAADPRWHDTCQPLRWRGDCRPRVADWSTDPASGRSRHQGRRNAGNKMFRPGGAGDKWLSVIACVASWL